MKTVVAGEIKVVKEKPLICAGYRAFLATCLRKEQLILACVKNITYNLS
jgi:hypothetical protein